MWKALLGPDGVVHAVYENEHGATIMICPSLPMVYVASHVKHALAIENMTCFWCTISWTPGQEVTADMCHFIL